MAKYRARCPAYEYSMKVECRMQGPIQVPYFVAVMEPNPVKGL